MAITEFFFAHLKPSYDYMELIEHLMEYFEAQDEWSHQHQPHIDCDEGEDNLSTLYVTKDASPILLIISPWDSMQAQEEWLQVETEAFKKLSHFFLGATNSVIRFFVHPVLTARETPDIKSIDTPVEVCTFSMNEEEKQSVLAEFEQLQKATLEKGGFIWGGWKLNTSKNADEFVSLMSRQGNLLEGFFAKLGLLGRLESRCFHPSV